MVRLNTNTTLFQFKIHDKTRVLFCPSITMNHHPTKTTEVKPHQTEPGASDLDHGWAWVVLCASFGAFLIIGGNIYGAGIIHIALLERYGHDITTTSWVGALLSSMVNIGGKCRIWHFSSPEPMAHR